jgi:TM2 domain-containing membrane protein YozV
MVNGAEISEINAPIIALVIYIAVIIFVIMIFGGLWIYRDAEKRGKNPELWLIIFLIASIIGYLIWLIVRPPKLKKKDGELK